MVGHGPEENSYGIVLKIHVCDKSFMSCMCQSMFVLISLTFTHHNTKILVLLLTEALKMSNRIRFRRGPFKPSVNPHYWKNNQ